MGFVYTNRESISIGIGCLVSDFARNNYAPYELLESFKKHPSVAPLLEGSEVKEYAAHLIPEGGYRAIPELAGDGWVVCGDAAQLNNAVHREGSNLALASGQMAGEAIADLKQQGAEPTKRNLALYRTRLTESFVMKDLKKYKDLPGLLHHNTQNFFLTYPQLVAKAMENFVRVDGTPKIEAEKRTFKSVLAARSLTGLVGDVVKIARAWR